MVVFAANRHRAIRYFCLRPCAILEGAEALAQIAITCLELIEPGEGAQKSAGKAVEGAIAARRRG